MPSRPLACNATSAFYFGCPELAFANFAVNKHTFIQLLLLLSFAPVKLAFIQTAFLALGAGGSLRHWHRNPLWHRGPIETIVGSQGRHVIRSLLKQL